MSDDSDSDESVTHLNIAIDFREDPADYPPIFIAQETATSKHCAPSSRRASTPIYAMQTVT